jgi:uncharacterized protein YcnI
MAVGKSASTRSAGALVATSKSFGVRPSSWSRTQPPAKSASKPASRNRRTMAVAAARASMRECSHRDGTASTRGIVRAGGPWHVERMRVALAFGVVLALAAPARAHMVVEPATSTAGAQQRYTLIVPTESQSPTVRVELRLPAGVDVFAVEAKPGWEASNSPFPVGAATVRWTGGRIPPGQMATFEFLATNPASARTLTWNAVQWFEDGTSERWGDGAPADHEASTTALSSPGHAASTAALSGPGHADGEHAGGDHRGAGTASALWIVTLSSAALAVAALLAALAGLRRADRA